LKRIKLFDPYVNIQEEKGIIKVLKSHNWASGNGGKYVEQFENDFKKFLGSNDCIAVNSGTAALNLSLTLNDYKNKEIILPSLTFTATANAVILNNAKPIFVDVDPKTLCIDIEQIKKSITKDTKAIIPVHFAGLACNLSEIMDLCKSHKIQLIEDAAHAAGTKYQNKRIGSHGDAVCFSFHPVKNLAMPTGGLISINNSKHKKIREKLSARRWCGISNRKDTDYDIKEMGWNYYMNEFSAVIGLAQLKKLDAANQIRQKIAERYHKELNLEEKMPFEKNCSYHFYWIRVKNQKKFRKKMNDVGIETGTHYKPVHTFSFYKKNNSLPVTEKIGHEIVSIPTHPNLTNKNIEKIIGSVNKFLD
jgi:perosamine synthetase